jgi:pimeloyl-ACP methyl ester carboxylesterase
MTTRRLSFPHEYVHLDAAIRRELVAHAAADGFPLTGILHRPARVDPPVAVLAMHPRGDFSRHYLAPALVGGGYAFFGATTRYLNHDADALHERLLLDVAGAIAFLREAGFTSVVLLGNSGGGSLFALYLEQAARAPAARLARAPSGDPSGLAEVELPAADGFVLVAAHLGEGRFLLDRLDPSVVDENDPTAVNPRLDMYDQANGYRPMHEGDSRYAPAFVAAFREGQRARCARLDRRALAWCEEAAHFRRRRGIADEMARLTAAERGIVVRGALQRRYFLVYRTLADPRYLDRSLDPSERALGSIFAFGRDPFVANYGEGLARTMSARGWLSTWSGLASNAALERTLPGVAVPTQMIIARADTDIYPEEGRRAFAAAAAADKSYHEISAADHYLRPVAGVTAPDGTAARRDPRAYAAEELILPWLRARWPV